MGGGCVSRLEAGFCITRTRFLKKRRGLKSGVLRTLAKTHGVMGFRQDADIRIWVMSDSRGNLI